jgi:hypothetical protein
MGSSLPYSSNRPSIVSEPGVCPALGLVIGDKNVESISTGAAISPGPWACIGTARSMPGEVAVVGLIAGSVYGPATASGPK